jgi:hypothetical protein
MMMSRPNLDSWKEPKIAWSQIWRVWWLGAVWNWVLNQKLMLCKRDVTRHIVVVQFPIVPSF